MIGSELYHNAQQWKQCNQVNGSDYGKQLCYHIYENLRFTFRSTFRPAEKAWLAVTW